MHLLWVANFAGDTGYAWDTIQAVFRGAGERLVRDGHRVTVCYASLPGGPPAVMRGAPFDHAAFDYGRGRARDFVRLLRARGVDALYLTDRPTWSWRYVLYRLAGVRTIVVHDRTSGARTVRGPAGRVVKRMLHETPGLSADAFIAVSDFVARRLVESNGAPPERTARIYNGIDLGRFTGTDRGRLHRVLGIPSGRPVLFCSGRAQPYKGMHVLLEAAALLRGQGAPPAAVAIAGDGPALDALRVKAVELGLDDAHFLGRRTDVAALLEGASIAVVPSLWEEAFGLTVVEAMAAGIPVVATRTGGIPELVDDGETGLLVPPGDPRALAGAIRRLLDDPGLRAAMGSRGRTVARHRFSLERSAAELYAFVSSRLRTAPAARLQPASFR